VNKTLLTFALVMASLFFGVTPGLAGTVWVIPPEAPTYLINSSAAGVDVLEAFIVSGAATFDNPGFTDLDPGWSAITVNPTYAVEYGSLSIWLTEHLNIVGTSLTVVDIYAFTGCASQFSATLPASSCPVGDLTDAYQAAFTNGGYVGWTALTADGLPFENSTGPNATPEPASMMLIGSGLIALSVRRYHKR
jgi:hypothetical protein